MLPIHILFLVYMDILSGLEALEGLHPPGPLTAIRGLEGLAPARGRGLGRGQEEKTHRTQKLNIVE